METSTVKSERLTMRLNLSVTELTKSINEQKKYNPGYIEQYHNARNSIFVIF